jgi:hypothetical protein
LAGVALIQRRQGESHDPGGNRNQPRPTPKGVAESSQQFRGRQVFPVGDKKGVTASRWVRYAGENDVDEVIKRKEAAPVVKGAEWERNTSAEQLHQASEIGLHTRTVDQGRTDYNDFHTGLECDVPQRELGLILGQAVRIHWRGRVSLGEPPTVASFLSIDFDRAEIDESPYTRSGGTPRECLSPGNIHLAKFGEWISRGVPHHVDAGGEMNHGFRALDRLRRARIGSQIRDSDALDTFSGRQSLS